VNSRVLSLLLSLSISIVTTAFLSLVTTEISELVVTFVISFSSAYLLIHLVLNFLIYNEINKVQKAINLLEPDFDKVDQRLEAMEWIAPTFFGITPPQDKQHPQYIGLADGFVVPLSYSYKIPEALELLRAKSLKKIEWWDRPQIDEDKLTYKTFRGKDYQIPLSPQRKQQLENLPLIKQYQFFELCFSPFDYFLVGQK